MKKKLLPFMVLLLALTILFVTTPQAKEEESTSAAAPIYFLQMDGAIGPAFSGYLDAGIKKANENKAQLVAIELSTPGGLLSTTREMATSIVESPVPIAVWVTPSGTHAASAGTFIVYAAHIAAMNEGTNIGAATPIEMKGQLKGQIDEADKQKTARDAKAVKNLEMENDLKEFLQGLNDPNQKAMREKAIEDTAAFIRGLAELRGRNAEWAEKAVVEADSITAKEALEKNVIDFIATNRSELLEKVNGKAVNIKNGDTVTLNTAHAPIVEFQPDWKTKFLVMITDPNIALILMSIGVYGLILEFYNPGSLVPGTIGAIALILGLFAMNVLPINAAGVALVGLGFIFIIAEAFIPSFGIMGFGGLAAFIVGSLIMFDTESMPGLALSWSVVGSIALFGALIVGLVMYLAAKAYRHKVTTGPEAMIGKDAKVTEWDEDHGRVFIQGEIWQAVSDGKNAFKPDDLVLVSAVEGLKLKVRAKV